MYTVDQTPTGQDFFFLIEQKSNMDGGGITMLSAGSQDWNQSWQEVTRDIYITLTQIKAQTICIRKVDRKQRKIRPVSTQNPSTAQQISLLFFVLRTKQTKFPRKTDKLSFSHSESHNTHTHMHALSSSGPF